MPCEFFTQRLLPISFKGTRKYGFGLICWNANVLERLYSWIVRHVAVVVVLLSLLACAMVDSVPMCLRYLLEKKKKRGGGGP